MSRLSILSIALLIHLAFTARVQLKDIINSDNRKGLNNTESKRDILCKIAGKYKQLCIRINDESNDDLAIYQKKYDCLIEAQCAYDNNEDKCQWLQTEESNECLKKYKPKSLRIIKKTESFQ